MQWGRDGGRKYWELKEAWPAVVSRWFWKLLS